MTPKEKAKDLVDRYMEYAYIAWNGGENEMTQEEAAKQCAIIAVNYRIEALNDMWLWDAIDEQKEIIEEIEKL